MVTNCQKIGGPICAPRKWFINLSRLGVSVKLLNELWIILHLIPTPLHLHLASSHPVCSGYVIPCYLCVRNYFFWIQYSVNACSADPPIQDQNTRLQLALVAMVWCFQQSITCNEVVDPGCKMAMSSATATIPVKSKMATNDGLLDFVFAGNFSHCALKSYSDDHDHVRKWSATSKFRHHTNKEAGNCCYAELYVFNSLGAEP